MTKDELTAAHELLLNNKYDYVSGRKPVPLLVGRLLAAHYLWPYSDDDTEWSYDNLLSNINSHDEDGLS